MDAQEMEADKEHVEPPAAEDGEEEELASALAPDASEEEDFVWADFREALASQDTARVVDGA
jgi:hypothetical protein